MCRDYSPLRFHACSMMYFFRLLFALCVACLIAAQVAAQPPNNAGQNAFQNVIAGPVNGPNANNAPFGTPNANATLNGNTFRGGAANADFDSLIDLIVSTVQPDMWADNGGTGDVRPFPGGVLVDAAGTLRLKSRVSENDLIGKRGVARGEAAAATGTPRRESALRYVSLTRLEREIARRRAEGEPLDASMLTLAGLRRVRYVFVYPESGDIVLAGPAGNWGVDPDGRILSTKTGEAVVRLDDLLVLLRRGHDSADSFFGCSINPRQKALAKTQAFLASTSQSPLQPGRRKQWLAELRDTVGKQDIEVFGVDPASRVAGVLIEADHHMKLIGMGLVDGVDGVNSYLDSIKLVADQSPPAMSVLRWWFTLNYDAIRRTAARDAFELVGQGVRVLSENEMLAEQGRRVHTGQSDALNRQFAERFTTHFADLAAKYPVYSELRNIFDLAMAVALIQSEGLAKHANWRPGLFADPEQLRLPQSDVPRQVETVVSHRVINRRHIIAGVSGGVMVAPKDVLAHVGTDAPADFAATRDAATPEIANGAWWWDAAE